MEYISCTSFYSSSSFFHSLCLGDSIFVQGSLNDSSDSFSPFVIMWFCRSSMRCKRSTTRTTSSMSVSFIVSRQNVESSRLNLRDSLNDNPWQWWSRSFFVSCDLLRQLQFRSHCLPRNATHKPSQFVDSQASLSVCLAQLLPRTTPFLVTHKTAFLFSHDDQQRFLESCDLQMN